jgi:hypothetical protein
MGTWSVDAFGNDDAADWAYELEGAVDLRPIEAAIDAVLDRGEHYLEASDAAIALAAIETLARLAGHAGEKTSYTEIVDQWVRRMPDRPTVELIDKAQAAITRILGENSELYGLWQDSDDLADWLASVHDLQARIGA